MLNQLTRQLARAKRTGDVSNVREDHLIAVLAVFASPKQRRTRSTKQLFRVWRRFRYTLVIELCRRLMELTGAARYQHCAVLLGGIAATTDYRRIRVYPETHYLRWARRLSPTLIGVELDRPLRLSAIEIVRRRYRPSVAGAIANRFTFGLWPMPVHCLGLTVAVLRAGGVTIPRRVTSIEALVEHLRKHHGTRTFDIHAA